jgi:excisionase family DNA binding protein
VNPYLHVDDVARMLGCSSRTVHEWTRLCTVPHRKPPAGRRCLFIEAEIREWIDGAALEVVKLPRGGRVVRPVPR